MTVLVEDNKAEAGIVGGKSDARVMADAEGPRSGTAKEGAAAPPHFPFTIKLEGSKSASNVGAEAKRGCRTRTGGTRTVTGTSCLAELRRSFRGASINARPASSADFPTCGGADMRGFGKNTSTEGDEAAEHCNWRHVCVDATDTGVTAPPPVA